MNNVLGLDNIKEEKKTPIVEVKEDLFADIDTDHEYVPYKPITPTEQIGYDDW
jgi:hypothetical protein